MIRSLEAAYFGRCGFRLCGIRTVKLKFSRGWPALSEAFQVSETNMRWFHTELSVRIVTIMGPIVSSFCDFNQPQEEFWPNPIKLAKDEHGP